MTDKIPYADTWDIHIEAKMDLDEAMKAAELARKEAVAEAWRTYDKAVRAALTAYRTREVA